MTRHLAQSIQLCACMDICLCVCMDVCMDVCILLSPSFCVPVRISVYASVLMYVCLSSFLLIFRPIVHISIYQSNKFFLTYFNDYKFS